MPLYLFLLTLSLGLATEILPATLFNGRGGRHDQPAADQRPHARWLPEELVLHSCLYRYRYYPVRLQFTCRKFNRTARHRCGISLPRQSIRHFPVEVRPAPGLRSWEHVSHGQPLRPAADESNSRQLFADQP